MYYSLYICIITPYLVQSRLILIATACQILWPKKPTSFFSCIKQARRVNFLWQLVNRNTLHFEPCPSGHYQRRCCWWPYPSTLLDTRPVFLTTPTNQHPYINDLYKIAHFSKMRKKRRETIGLLGWYQLFTSLAHFGRYCHKRCMENNDGIMSGGGELDPFYNCRARCPFSFSLYQAGEQNALAAPKIFISCYFQCLKVGRSVSRLIQFKTHIHYSSWPI